MQSMIKQSIIGFAALLWLAGCGQQGGDSSGNAQTDDKPMSQSAESQSESAAQDPTEVLRASMKAKNGVGLDRLDKNDLQKACSNPDDNAGDQSKALREAAMAAIEFPGEGEYLGDWKKGEAIASNGKGMQYSDNPDEPNGGNCYACHELAAGEVAYGTIGPSLKNYGQRGQSEAMLKYTWGKIWNPNAYTVCSHMPRFGDAGILTTDQIRHLMAFLLDPESPVNTPAE